MTRWRRGLHRAAAGFTLLEMLVAMAILMVIMLMMATIFHQSNVAWSTGFREVDMSMQGRAALNLISEELSDALADEMLQCKIANGTSLEFYSMKRAMPDSRAFYRVKFERSGNSLMRSYAEVQVQGQAQPPSSPPVEVVDGVVSFAVTVPDGPYTTNLPPWVELQLVLEKTDANASVKVWSTGRDRTVDGSLDMPPDDDVRSWKVDGQP